MKAIYVSPDQPSARAGQWTHRPISDVMSKPVLSVPLDTLLDEALSAMAAAGFRHLAAVDGTGRCVGVLATRGIAAAWAAHHDDLPALAVGQVVDQPATVGVHATVIDAAHVMRSSGVDAVAVVDSRGLPVGIFTSTDLVSLLAA